ncbi:unnamed protein product, partial [Medioppia subpectinata]
NLEVDDKTLIPDVNDNTETPEVNDNIAAPEATDQVLNSYENTEPTESAKWWDAEGLAISGLFSDLIPDEIEIVLHKYALSPQVIVFTFIISFCWCLAKILISCFSSSNKETELREMCNKSQRQAYYFEAEKEKLQSEVHRETENARIAVEKLQILEQKVHPLEKACQKYKSEREQLQQRVIGLESDLESAAEAGLEANRLLNDFLTSQKENVSLNSSVDALQQQITRQTDIVSKYESKAKQKETENKELKEKTDKMSAELERLKNVLKETSLNLETFQKNNDELKASKSELSLSFTELEERYSSLQLKADDYIERNDELLNDFQKLSHELEELKEEKNHKDLEIESFKEILSKLRRHPNKDSETNDEDNDNEEDGEERGEDGDQMDSAMHDKALSDLYDIVEMDLKLKNVTIDKNELSLKLEEVSKRCEELNHKLESLEEENRSIKTESEGAVKDRLKAQMELEVLTKYYKEKEVELGKEIGVQHIQRQQKEEDEKEVELGKEIGVQHIQRQQKEEDVNSMSSQLSALEEENVSLRDQLQSMKKEVSDTENKLKTQINQLEKQVHENWIIARTAQRSLDESKAEASVLRQTLTMSVKSPIDGYAGDASFMDDSASSVSSMHDHFGALPPPPPPPPMPPIPPPALFNQMMAGMQMPYNEEMSDPTALWNQHQMMPPIPPPFLQMTSQFAPIRPDNAMANDLNNSYNSMLNNQNYNSMANDPNSSYNSLSNDPNMSYNSTSNDPNSSYTSMANNQSAPYTSLPHNSQPVNNYVTQVSQQWETHSNRDTYSPSSHRSTTGSPHQSFPMYSQPNNHYSNPLLASAANSMSSPMHNNSISNHMQSSQVNNSLVNTSPSVVQSSQSVNMFSEPIPSHWAQPNGNIPNLNNNYSHHEYNESQTVNAAPTTTPATTAHTTDPNNSFYTSVV